MLFQGLIHKEADKHLTGFGTIHECDRQTDRQTDGLS